MKVTNPDGISVFPKSRQHCYCCSVLQDFNLVREKAVEGGGTHTFSKETSGEM